MTLAFLSLWYAPTHAIEYADSAPEYFTSNLQIHLHASLLQSGAYKTHSHVTPLGACSVPVDAADMVLLDTNADNLGGWVGLWVWVCVCVCECVRVCMRVCVCVCMSSFLRRVCARLLQYTNAGPCSHPQLPSG